MNTYGSNPSTKIGLSHFLPKSELFTQTFTELLTLHLPFSFF